MPNYQFDANIRAYDLQNFRPETLRIESELLKGNPLKDSHIRFNPVLVPTNVDTPLKVVFVLGGFSGNAPFYFNPKFNEQNTVQLLDQAVDQGEAPEALYVFIDALTAWGGSQFLNSDATGKYEDYIIQEILPALHKQYTLSEKAEDWCVMGGSSGGYGALHLASKYPEHFGLLAAIAPDSFFEASLLKEIYDVLPLWEKYQKSGVKALEELRNGKIKKMRNWHTVLNVFGMASCYSAMGTRGDFTLPLDTYTGKIIPEIWQTWLQHDPLFFLKDRSSNLKKLSRVFLDVGSKDNFHLQYGTRQIHALLEAEQVPCDFSEFDGNHFDIGERRPEVFRWLTSLWRS